MKLAEALLLRSDLQKKITQLTSRITPNLKVQKGHKPQEDPVKILAQLRKAVADFEAIVIKINKTNILTILPDGRTLMEGLAQRDGLKTMVAQLRLIRQHSVISNMGYSNIEATMKIKDIQSEIDQTGRKFREIDSIIQGLNWTTELID